MSAPHHESFDDPLKERLLDQFLNRARPDFPEGRLNSRDGGALSFAVAVDRKNQVVIIDFGKPVSWFALPKKELQQLIDLLQEKVKELP